MFVRRLVENKVIIPKRGKSTFSPNTVEILHIKVRCGGKLHLKARGLSLMAQKALRTFAVLSLSCSKLASQGAQVSPLLGEGNVHLAYGSIKNLISHSHKCLFVLTPEHSPFCWCQKGRARAVHVSQDQTR